VFVTIASSSIAPKRLRDSWLALAGLSGVFLFEMLDNSILGVALPTIGRQLHASTIDLQWVTNAYAVVFGGLMLVFGAAADRFGRRRVMLTGLTMLGVASLATAFVSNASELVAVRIVMGVAAAMTAPGSAALTFRLFDDEKLRVRAFTLISTVGLIGLALGPTASGFVLSFAPWQVLLLINVPVAILAIIGIRLGVGADNPAELHRDPADVRGAVYGTAAIVFAVVAPTLFVEQGVRSWAAWTLVAATVGAAWLFIARERSAAHPLLDLALVARPLVSSGLAFKAAAGMATSGLGYLVTLQLQLDWGWSPMLAAIGMLPQVIVLVAGGPFVSRFINRVGPVRSAWMSSSAIVVGLAVYGALGGFGYVFVAIALALVAAGLRVIGVVAGLNVMTGLPANRTSIGAALVDTASEVTSAVGVAVAGTILAAMFTGSIATSHWTTAQHGEFRDAVMISGLVLTGIAAALVVWAMRRARAVSAPAPAPSDLVA
jgi:MFS family permease